MDPLLTGAVVSIVFVVLMIALASKLGRNRERSAARVEALRALVAESSQAVHPAALSPAPDATEEDEWDLPIHEERPVEDHCEMPQPAATAVRVVTTTQQFVVHVPDAAGARFGQVSFEHRGSRS